MSPNQLKLIGALILILVMVALKLWFPSHAHQADVQRILDQADRDVAAAKAAADRAAGSATRARDTEQDLRNRLPGSS